MDLVGNDRRAQVDELEALFHQSVRIRQPFLVSLEAGLGLGKTRIVQALYEQLAQQQPVPQYWPPGLVEVSETDPLRLRKRVMPQTFLHGVPMPWMWWGLSCGRTLDGLSEHVLARDIHRIEQHLQPEISLRQRREDARAAVGSVVDLAVSLTPVGNVKSGYDAFESVVRAGMAEHAFRRQSADAVPVRAQAGDVGQAPLVQRSVALMRLAGQAGRGLVMVIDDAHDADASVLALLEAVFQGPIPEPVLCVCTSWPDQLRIQSSERTGFGWWLEKSAERDPGRCLRRPLVPLSIAESTEIVRSRAPTTEADVVAAFAARADGNPLVLAGLLALPRVTRATTASGGILLAPNEVLTLQNTYHSIMLERWDALPDPVQEALSLCSLQGRDALRDLVRHSYEVAVPANPGGVESALDQAIDPYAWLRDVESLLHFDELYTLEVAENYISRFLADAQLDQVRHSIAERIAGYRRDGGWTDQPDSVALALRRIHVRLGRMGALADWGAAAASAHELGLAAFDQGLYEESLQLAHDALRWAPADKIELRVASQLLVARVTCAHLDPIEGLARLEGVDTESRRRLGASHEISLSARTGLARMLSESGDWRRAQEILTQLIEDSTGELGKAHDTTLDARYQLAVTLLQQGDMSGARNEVAELLPIRRHAFGDRHVDTVEAQVLQAHLMALDRPEAAREIMEAVVLMAQQALGADHPHVLDARSSLALVLRQLGYLAEARHRQEQLIADYARILGAGHERTLNEGIRRAETLVLSGDPSGSRELRTAVEDLEKRLGQRHPETLAAHVTMAESSASQGDLRSAIVRLDTVLKDLDVILGDGHLLVTSARELLAGWLLSEATSGREVDRALQLLDLNHRQCVRSFGPHHRRSVWSTVNLAVGMAANGRLDEAKAMLSSLQAELEAEFGPEARETQVASLAVGDFWQRVGDVDAAYSCYVSVHGTRSAQLGPAHTDTIEAALRTTTLLQRHGYVVASQQLNEELYSHARQTLGSNHPVTAEILASIADAATATGDCDRATRALRRLVQIREQVLGRQHLQTLQARRQLTVCLHDNGETTEARSLVDDLLPTLQRAVEAAETTLGADRPLTLALRHELAWAYGALDRQDEARAAAPRVGGRLSAGLPRRCISTERLTLVAPDRLSRIEGETQFLPSGIRSGPKYQRRTVVWFATFLISCGLLGALIGATIDPVPLLIVVLVVATALWVAVGRYLTLRLFGLHVTPWSQAADRRQTLTTLPGYEPRETRSTGSYRAGTVEHDYAIRDGTGRTLLCTESYRVVGSEVLTITATVPEFATDREAQIRRAMDSVTFYRPKLTTRLERELARRLGKGVARGTLRAVLPAGWDVEESLQIMRLDARGNIITTIEPVDSALTPHDYADRGGADLAELTDYREHSFTPHIVFTDRQGWRRRFSWRSTDGFEVSQAQDYFTQNGYGYRATATCRQTDAESLSGVLLDLMSTITVTPREPSREESPAA